MTKSLLIITKFNIGKYDRRGGKRDSTKRVFNLKGEGIINLKILRKKMLVVEWSETTDMRTMFTQRTKVEIDLPLVASASLVKGLLTVNFPKGSCRSMIGAQPWNVAKRQRDKVNWLKELTGPPQLASACAESCQLTCQLHNTETKIRKDLRCILSPKQVTKKAVVALPPSISDVFGDVLNMSNMKHSRKRSADELSTSTLPGSHSATPPQSVMSPQTVSSTSGLSPQLKKKRSSMQSLTSTEQMTYVKPRSLSQLGSTMQQQMQQMQQQQMQQRQQMQQQQKLQLQQLLMTPLSTSMYMQNGIPSGSVMSQMFMPNGLGPNGLGLNQMNGVSAMNGLVGGMNGLNSGGMNLSGFPSNASNMNKSTSAIPISVESSVPKKHTCVMNTQCQSCAINICGTCSVVAGCGCGPFCNSCFEYTDTCSGCGHTQCEHCVLNSLNSSCGCLPKPDVITKLEDLGCGNVAGYMHNFFADWE